MATINLDPDYPHHPKTRRLVALLGNGSDVLPVRLLCYTAKYHPDEGRLAEYSAAELEACIEWWGEPGKAVDALLRVHILERDGNGYRVHDWQQWQGHIARYRQKALAMAKSRWAKLDAASNAASIPASNATGNANAAHNSAAHGMALQNDVVTTHADDELDGEIRRFCGEHPSLLWNLRAHANLRKLVQAAGWDETRRLINEAASKGASHPASYALQVWAAIQGKEAARRANEADVDAIVKKTLGDKQ